MQNLTWIIYFILDLDKQVNERVIYRDLISDTRGVLT